MTTLDILRCSSFMTRPKLRHLSRSVVTRSQKLALFNEHHSFVSCIEPKNVEEALQDPDWINDMHEELNNFTRNEV